MTDLLFQYLSTISPRTIMTALAVAALVFWYILKNHHTITDLLNRFYDNKKNKENLLNTIHENQAEIRQLMENRLHDREQSLAIQKELTDAQKELAGSIAVISDKLDDMQRNTDARFKESEQKNNKRIRAELKDKISQSYRYYHSLGRINDMELDALEDLIAEYEAADGSNSFVHSVVQKEMYTWEKVDRM